MISLQKILVTTSALVLGLGIAPSLYAAVEIEITCSRDPNSPPSSWCPDFTGNTNQTGTVTSVQTNNSSCPPGTPAGQLCYTPLEPLPGLGDAQTGTGSFAALIEGFFTLLLSIGAFLAVTTLVMGGISYMFSDKLLSKSVARDRIKAAFVGLGILGAAVLLLGTINPQLITFDKDLLSPTNTSAPGTSGTSTTAPFRFYSASSVSGQQYAAQHGALQDNPSGALMMVTRGSENSRDFQNAYRKMYSDCEDANGSMQVANSVERQTYVYMCIAD